MVPKTLSDGFMDLVNVQKSNSSFSFLVFSSKIHRFLRLKCTDEWPVQKKSLEPKYLVVIIGDQSQRDSKFDWSLICYNFYFLTQQFRKDKEEGEKCVCAVEKCWWVLLFAKGKKCVLVVCKFSKLHSKNVALKNLRWHWIFNYRFTSLLAIFQSTFNRMLRAAKTNRIFFKLVL